MFLGRVIGRVVCTRKAEGLEGVALQIVQRLDEAMHDLGTPFVACDTAQSGLGDVVFLEDGREGCYALPVFLVPVDAVILGHVEEVTVPDRGIAWREAR
ncbi:MAG: EutN/CcmL family microcompartment protein [Planctomycetes bacterium]|nr:EutN/CcmL family microcompartment protein [Planctomycetota bacterium]MBI3845750.1 EutN/CcmL family microcompartment protein [Planctomycetota bacterium]